MEWPLVSTSCRTSSATYRKKPKSRTGKFSIDSFGESLSWNFLAYGESLNLFCLSRLVFFLLSLRKQRYLALSETFICSYYQMLLISKNVPSSACPIAQHSYCSNNLIFQTLSVDPLGQLCCVREYTFPCFLCNELVIAFQSQGR